ncbi:hypothetical protein [Methanosarcina mazei]|nr:hypothetical protein [Methanosarcina mazei]
MLSASSGGDFLPEMTLKAESMANLADDNSRNRPARRTKKSKLLKFSADPRSDFETDTDESILIPEPEPEKIIKKLTNLLTFTAPEATLNLKTLMRMSIQIWTGIRSLK